MELYLQHVDERSSSATRQHHTQRAYARALKKFLEVVAQAEGLDPGAIPVTDVDPDWVDPYLDWLKQTRCALSTEQLRLAAVNDIKKRPLMTTRNAHVLPHQKSYPSTSRGTQRSKHGCLLA
jgi:hypothetical protein